MRVFTQQFLSAAFALSLAGVLIAQQPQPAAWAVPRVVRVSSSFRPANGLAALPVESLLLTIYAEEVGGVALWQETQNVAMDGEGRFSVLLGSTRNEGLPLELFAAGEPRWVAVHFQRPGEVEQPRILLASVPYALKAVDADTLGGQPASAYLLAPRTEAAAGQAGPGTAPSSAPGRLTPKSASGTANNIAKFINSLDLGNSVMVESNGKIGIGTSVPAAALEIVTTGGGAQFTNTLANNFTFNTFSSPGNASYLYNFGNAYPTSGRYVQNSTLVDAGNILSLSAPANVRFYTNGNNERMRIDGSGNVGIGILTPAKRLDVAGDMNLTGSFFKSGIPFLHTAGGDTNIAVGINALSSNTIGYGNAAGGFQALFSNKDAFGNTGFGAQALYTNVSGIGNTAVGDSALVFTIAGGNTATGYAALYNDVTGDSNTAVGFNALHDNIDGSHNTAVGYQALMNAKGENNFQNTAIGYGALPNASGVTNTAIGAYAGMNLTDGFQNIAIGACAYGVAGESGTIRIGGPDCENRVFIQGIKGITTGNHDGVPVLVDSAGQLGVSNSSRRYKEDIRDMGNASSSLLLLRPVTYRYKQAYADGSKPIDYGLIAEEVAEVYPDLVVKGKDGQIETVQYQKLTPMLLNEVQKLRQDAEKQSLHVRRQDETIHGLETRLAVLEAMLSSKVVTSSQQP